MAQQYRKRKVDPKYNAVEISPGSRELTRQSVPKRVFCVFVCVFLLCCVRADELDQGDDAGRAQRYTIFHTRN